MLSLSLRYWTIKFLFFTTVTTFKADAHSTTISTTARQWLGIFCAHVQTWSLSTSTSNSTSVLLHATGMANCIIIVINNCAFLLWTIISAKKTNEEHVHKWRHYSNSNSSCTKLYLLKNDSKLLKSSYLLHMSTLRFCTFRHLSISIHIMCELCLHRISCWYSKFLLERTGCISLPKLHIYRVLHFINSFTDTLGTKFSKSEYQYSKTDTIFSQSSVVMRLSCVETFNNHFIANLLLTVPEKEFWKFGGLVRNIFWGTRPSWKAKKQYYTYCYL